MCLTTSQGRHSQATSQSLTALPCVWICVVSTTYYSIALSAIVLSDFLAPIRILDSQIHTIVIVIALYLLCSVWCFNYCYCALYNYSALELVLGTGMVKNQKVGFLISIFPLHCVSGATKKNLALFHKYFIPPWHPEKLPNPLYKAGKKFLHCMPCGYSKLVSQGA